MGESPCCFQVSGICRQKVDSFADTGYNPYGVVGQRFFFVWNPQSSTAAVGPASDRKTIRATIATTRAHRRGMAGFRAVLAKAIGYNVAPATITRDGKVAEAVDSIAAPVSE